MQSLAAALSSTVKKGDFGNHLCELRGGLRFMQAARASLIAARFDEQRKELQRSVVEGVFFFGFFLLDKQKKESRQSGETDMLYKLA